MLSAVNWVGGGDGHSWSDTANWSTHALPSANDDVTINVPGNPTVVFNGTSSIRNLTDADSLFIAGGSLTLTAGASNVAGSLNISQGATFAVNGSGVTFSDGSATTINGASLYAYGGASMTLSAATSSSGDNLNSYVQANGVGPGNSPSLIALPNMTTLFGGLSYYTSHFDASNGGKIDLSGVTSDLGGSLEFTAKTGGEISLNPNLTSLSNTSITLNGGKIPVGQLTSFTNGSIEVDSGTASFSGLTSIDGDSVYAYGGAAISFPGVTNYAGILRNTYIRADGVGPDNTPSKIDLSHVTTLFGALAYFGNDYYTAFFSVSHGATIDLSSATSDLGGSLQFTARTGGTISISPNLTKLDRTDVTLDGGSFPIGQFTSFTNGIIEADSGTASFSGLTSIDGDSVYAYGGAAISFPGVTNYAGILGNTYIQANGVGSDNTPSNINLSHVATLSGALPYFHTASYSYYYTAFFNAYNGAKIDLSHVEFINGGSYNLSFNAVGAGSVIDLSSLLIIGSSSPNSSSLLNTSGGGMILDPALGTIPPLFDTTTSKTVNTVFGSNTGGVVLATFTVKNPYVPVSDFSASVNWTPNSSPSGILTGNPTVSVQLVSRTAAGSTWQVVGSVTYARIGSFTPVVTVNDIDGAVLQTSKTTFKVTGYPTQLVSDLIQTGQTQRSFIRYVDVYFSDTAGLSRFVTGQGIQLVRYDINGLNPTVVALSGLIALTGTHLRIDFGANGIGGNRLTNAGDGTYVLSFDLAGTGVLGLPIQFTRLLGDITGDGNVDANDISAYQTDLKNGDLNADVNGDGVLNAADLLLVRNAQGRKIKKPV